MAGQYSNIARAMIVMWNSKFSKIIYKRQDGFSINLNPIKLFSWLNPINRNSNKRLRINEYKTPDISFFTSSCDGLKIAGSIWLNHNKSDKWIIGAHGYNSNRIEVLYLLWHYRQLGYNIITFDFRNHGASDGELTTWGYQEKQDLKAIINWLIEKYKVATLGLVGASMGAFTINYFLLTELELIKKANIKWAVSDSSYMSAKHLLRKMVNDNSPKFLHGIGNEVLNDILMIYKDEYKVDLSELNFTTLIEPSKQYIPVLYFHNRYDKVTNYLDSFKMCRIKNSVENSDKNQVKIYDDGIHHTKSIIEYEDDYISRSLNFVRRNENASKNNQNGIKSIKID
ncbi:alpha/beta hydrolase [Mycoplasma putrefaciens]|uniref:AB hydrolase-1 domain-containing protein n=1 Tax=Mycoplasma putrefaciens Mput9231 TaxID=1292033 RepID=M9WHB4_9MOLU|nr:alpha/beta hydrolase [Mycoplasma putrefaciens]AGJ90779.1 Hypothetical protein, putative alpha/beta hydrolase [Mycoplasma putrefaciens Mput9231]